MYINTTISFDHSHWQSGTGDFGRKNANTKLRGDPHVSQNAFARALNTLLARYRWRSSAPTFRCLTTRPVSKRSASPPKWWPAVVFGSTVPIHYSRLRQSNESINLFVPFIGHLLWENNMHPSHNPAITHKEAALRESSQKKMFVSFCRCCDDIEQ
jgi:hypothetical protein